MSRVQRQREEKISRQRYELADRLEQARQTLADQAVARIQAIADVSTSPLEGADENIGRGVGAGIDLAIGSVRGGQVIDEPLPAVLMAQTRRAAQSGVPLSDLHQRYLAVFGLIAEELFVQGIDSETLRVVMRDGTSQFDRLVKESSAVYANATSAQSAGDEDVLNRVKAILQGETVDAGALNYPLQVVHIGIAGIGKAAEDALREMATRLGLIVLSADPQVDISWIWIGARDNLEATKITAFADQLCGHDGLLVGFGEPAEGIPGFRRTHREARAALHVAQRRRRPARYSQVALLSSILKDDLLVLSLKERFLEPLERDEDGGKAARETLKAYFAAGHKVSSAAAALNINRRTVKNRLSALERRFNQPLDIKSAEVEAALLLADLPIADADGWFASPT
ncbi:MAG TPA: helix-turn-helix domain-containing protein [Solirubrobacterales bacterium]|nr:helix-turn-helix domain-containing protein [Solirubrobacterales bacterium]